MGSANAQYWYQFGARGGITSTGNSGASVSIQTITPQTSDFGSIGYWVGEDLSNGAFLQAGYVIENQSGSYPSFCDMSGCSNYQQLNAGDAQWFYEYFPAGFSGGFLGRIGPADSAGRNGTFHSYSFYFTNGQWDFAVDGNVVGNTTLGTSTSGSNAPVAFGEIANTTGVAAALPHVIFNNLSAYKNGAWFPAQSGTAYIGYGVGSLTNLKNPYGVEEITNRVNYFAVGSGLPQPRNNSQLWSLGYSLSVVSAYGNVSSSGAYVAYSSVKISAPQSVQLSGNTREVFAGWKGTGIGSYSGPLDSVTLSMDSNITETAQWQTQYLLNVSSPYGQTYGSGWYALGSSAGYGIRNGTVPTSATSREVFEDWSNGNAALGGTATMNGPTNINATWTQQFLVTLQSQYGNATGGGWYNYGGEAKIGINIGNITVSPSERIAFYQWSNGNLNRSFFLNVTGPQFLTAQFRKIGLATFNPQNANGESLGNVTLYMGNSTVGQSEFLFENQSYTISYAYYKGVRMIVSDTFTFASPGPVDVKLPVYNVQIATRDLFGQPIQSAVSVRFSNDSVLRATTGSSGMINFTNVPYGYVNVTASNLGITQQAVARNGGTTSLLFVSNLDMAIFAGVIAAIAGAFFVARHFARRPGQSSAQQA
ncbi:MAG: hypothetical protein KGH78_01715 [Candidatus Micrarchaeota archaeon]|nr:hypothetical protein [Candidatus Micrarchaeota archaeon]